MLSLLVLIGHLIAAGLASHRSNPLHSFDGSFRSILILEIAAVMLAPLACARTLPDTKTAQPLAHSPGTALRRPDRPRLFFRLCTLYSGHQLQSEMGAPESTRGRRPADAADRFSSGFRPPGPAPDRSRPEKAAVRLRWRAAVGRRRNCAGQPAAGASLLSAHPPFGLEPVPGIPVPL